MIPQAYITAWRKKAPWQEDFQVEQDLVIERALMAIYSNDYLKERLAFRGGTALHKLYLSPAARYSEDCLSWAINLSVSKNSIIIH
jgi:predicted nucleotidyltransferase component of viral defense system